MALSASPYVQEVCQWVGIYGFLSSHQVKRLLPDRSDSSVNRSLKTGVELGLLKATRPAVSDVYPGRIEGRAPYIYSLTAKGLRRVEGWVRVIPTLTLHHELLLRDFCIWTVEVAKHYGFDAPRTFINDPVLKKTRPDVVVVIPLPENLKLGLLVELDTGSMRGAAPWLKKCRMFADLFASQELSDLIGIKGARVAVVSQSRERRDNLSALIRGLDPQNWWRWWFVCQDDLASPDLRVAFWLNEGALTSHLPD